MVRIIKGMPKDIRVSVKWVKDKSGIQCSYCNKETSDFRFLWIDPFLNILCGCPGFHYALNMKCIVCNTIKEIALGNDQHLTSYCPKCFS
jgi:hypothetical protein